MEWGVDASAAPVAFFRPTQRYQERPSETKEWERVAFSLLGGRLKKVANFILHAAP